MSSPRGDDTRPDNRDRINEVTGEVGFREHRPSDHDYYDSDSDDMDSECSGVTVDHEVFIDFPEGLRTVKPLTTEEELEYGAMEIVQNPWEYFDGNSLPPSIKTLLSDSISE